MTSPSVLIISISALQRLIREEASYHRELSIQEARVKRLSDEQDRDEYQEWNLKQERQALEETRVLLPILKKKIREAMQRLERHVETVEARGSTMDELEKAKEVIQNAKAALA
ncbi:Tubulin-specific chaperone A [Golovinomyces cichoracearum]|uniref:Tubulin-specific chaperone A n=1 Tax=Golovinomyces cichoracearum TaxID=62708 RepID=A0A420ISE0_9PEZI|nr:Tubulin-specific chaperone A [Golovinomyces cichoracearum]RKF77440.1 Tubulin-specific chaperone A [Golovinomyces cichoracearum]RKF81959.1 Tubulin-specific chaperone A [Golovinomyces cichoracearum]